MTTVVILILADNNMTNSIEYGWALLGISAVGSCAGNLFLKQANLVLSDPSLLAVVTSSWFFGAIACYIVDLIFFSLALQYLPVSSAVPVISGVRIAATAILAYVFFGEHITTNQFWASSLITVGIFVMLRN